MNLLIVFATVFMAICCLPMSTVLAAESSILADSDLSANLGYRVDQLDWSIAGDSTGQNPNILSELSWRDIKSIQLQLDGSLELKPALWSSANTYLQGSVAYGSVYSGSNQDSDYAADNRTFEWSRSENSADEGFTFDISGAVGPKFNQIGNFFSVTPLIGYSFHIQDLSISNGNQTVSDEAVHTDYFHPTDSHPPAVGAFAGLDSSYTAYWYGPWLGMTVTTEPAEKWQITLSGEYHWIEYFAEANWNLRTDLAHPVSFENEARGNGIVWALETAYAVSERWSLQLSGNLQYWQTDPGTDTTYLAKGTRGGTQLNEVNWDSYALMTGLNYRF